MRRLCLVDFIVMCIPFVPASQGMEAVPVDFMVGCIPLIHGNQGEEVVPS